MSVDKSADPVLNWGPRTGGQCFLVTPDQESCVQAINFVPISFLKALRVCRPGAKKHFQLIVLKDREVHTPENFCMKRIKQLCDHKV